MPLLRKEFMIDEYQVYEAKAMGADIILLIGAILDRSEAERLTNLAHDLGLEVLYEIHHQSELDHMPDNIDILGINNRNLKTFKVDYAHSIKILNELPQSYPVISESGISQPDTIIELYNAGFNGFLIGETFMKTDNPGIAFSDFITECRLKLKNL
jgi:indole-3-glycerol phosphate synthase